MNCPRVAVIHPDLRGGAGSEARAVWLAEALKTRYRVTLASMGPINLEKLNSMYGTGLSAGEVSTVSLPKPRGLGHSFDALRSYPLGRWAKAAAKEFEVMISCYNMMDFGRRGIQFVADFSFDDELRRSLDPAPSMRRKALYRKSPLRSAYLRLGRMLGRQSDDGWRKNLTIANSEWTRRLLEEKHGLAAEVIYPPVQSEPSGMAWEKRENGFVVLARMAPEKRIERTIAVIGEARRSGLDIHLHILAREDQREYAAEIRDLCQRNSTWAHYEGFVVGERKREMIARHRFGMSSRKSEPFGISVAEMVGAGCIVWVPNGGGQIEIVDHPELIYESDTAAVCSILRVLESPDLQESLRNHLSDRARIFSTERFCRDAGSAVDAFIRRPAAEGTIAS